MPITKIVSGGQTGADRGGLDAALYCEVPHGGWCPKGRKAEDGVIPAKYELTEMETSDYLARTEANVVDSDATLVFVAQNPSGGSLRTIEFCMKYRKPWHHFSLEWEPREKIAQVAMEWLAGRVAYEYDGKYLAKPPAESILNVAGSRESKYPGIEDAVMRIMVDILIAVNPACKRFYPLPSVQKAVS